MMDPRVTPTQPTCGPADGPAIYFAIGLESGDECQSALDEDFASDDQSFGKTPPLNQTYLYL